MTLSLPRGAALLAGAGSLGLLLGAFGFQYIGAIPPCPMCLWQRWPHALAAILGVAAATTGRVRLCALAGAAAMTVSTGLGIFHSGVERHWWDGPSTCTSSAQQGLEGSALFDQIMNAPLVRCDEIAWDLAGLSMPNFNAIFSLLLLALWIATFAAAWRR
ncbi:disulfide bond formation protein B [Mangrovicoccus algicola]|uniref:Disulfide bond formation protein B n=1 Tax=Mangrovicoccus algicola TaxID=2771008 RepID=A0A8J6YUC3_9RHOB|nr:disulfide bond formation protein B [Mangrovicoccus algicola]MBE3637747.1 disulfide bond formation protein B [Mangrovicoccus algicola]